MQENKKSSEKTEDPTLQDPPSLASFQVGRLRSIEDDAQHLPRLLYVIHTVVSQQLRDCN